MSGYRVTFPILAWKSACVLRPTFAVAVACCVRSTIIFATDAMILES
jgi:hypothetical protein